VFKADLDSWTLCGAVSYRHCQPIVGSGRVHDLLVS